MLTTLIEPSPFNFGDSLVIFAAAGKVYAFWHIGEAGVC
jgi:hypothetical protein